MADALTLRSLTSRRKKALAAQKAALDAEHEARLARVAEDAQRELEAQAAIAAAEADSNRRAKDAADARKLQRLMAKEAPSVDCGTVAERETWRARADVSLEAIGQAASCPVSQWWRLEDPRAAVSLGLPPVPAAFFAAVSAVHALYAASLNTEEKAAESERQAAVDRALADIAAERMAEWEAMKETERKMEA